MYNFRVGGSPLKRLQTNTAVWTNDLSAEKLSPAKLSFNQERSTLRASAELTQMSLM